MILHARSQVVRSTRVFDAVRPSNCNDSMLDKMYMYVMNSGQVANKSRGLFIFDATY